MTDSTHRTAQYDEHEAFVSACKGEPYAALEWKHEVKRLETELEEARMGHRIARERGVCLAARFGGPLKEWRDSNA
jgi:ligand-binding SRPBCC domain-containing protein